MSAPGIGNSDPYTWRSGATTGGLLFWDTRNDTVAIRARTEAAIAETKRLRGLVAGAANFYILANLDEFGWSDFGPDLSTWAAWQWAGGAGGAAMFFRRSNASAPTITVSLFEIDHAARYAVSMSATYTRATNRTMLGAELAELTVGLPQPRASMLLEYARIG